MYKELSCGAFFLAVLVDFPSCCSNQRYLHSVLSTWKQEVLFLLCCSALLPGSVLCRGTILNLHIKAVYFYKVGDLGLCLKIFVQKS